MKESAGGLMVGGGMLHTARGAQRYKVIPATSTPSTFPQEINTCDRCWERNSAVHRTEFKMRGENFPTVSVWIPCVLWVHCIYMSAHLYIHIYIYIYIYIYLCDLSVP